MKRVRARGLNKSREGKYCQQQQSGNDAKLAREWAALLARADWSFRLRLSMWSARHDEPHLLVWPLHNAGLIATVVLSQKVWLIKEA